MDETRGDTDCPSLRAEEPESQSLRNLVNPRHLDSGTASATSRRRGVGRPKG